MSKIYQIVDRTTREIVQEFKTEKEITAKIRNWVLPCRPQYLLEYDVYVIEDGNVTSYPSLYDYAVQTRVIKGKVK